VEEETYQLKRRREKGRREEVFTIEPGQSDW
jgi:hypothetical protein